MKHVAPANLVHMDAFGRSRTGVSPTDATRLLHKCRASAMQRLSAAASGVMNKVDDTLFELADKAENNAIQTLYFDAMREVRIRRGSIETAFGSRLVERYNQAVKGESGSGAGSAFLDGPELTLGLVEDDDLEESLAVDGMVSKVRELCESELFAFDLRMGVLLDRPELKPEDNPLAPEAICTTFREACDQLGSGIQIRLILLKLFDKFAAALLPQLYCDLNRYLIDNEVLPKIPQSKPTRSSTPTVPSPTAGSAEAAPVSQAAPIGQAAPVGQSVAVGQAAPVQTSTTAGDNVLATLHQLLAMGASVPGAPQAKPGSVGLCTLQQLTQLQRGHVEQVPGASVVLNAAQLESGGVNVLHQLKQAPIGEGGGRIDDLTVDIVAMLFDFVLEDREIPDFMKALIGRLQIPILKVAMLDRSVFSKRTHPARRLVNALADAAVGWTEADQANNPVFAKAQAVVNRVLSDFEDDVALFAELLAEFELFRTEAEHEAEQRAKDSVKLVQGKEQLDQAKNLARREVARRTSTEGIPPAVRYFLKQHWVDFLTVAHMAQSEDGEQWQSAVDVMDRLVWSVEPKATVEDRAQLVRLLPGLLRDLREGMEIISVEDNERATFLAELATLHARAVSGRNSRSGSEEQPAGQAVCGRETRAAEPQPEPLLDDMAEERREPFADVLRYGTEQPGGDVGGPGRDSHADTPTGLAQGDEGDDEDRVVEEITLEGVGESALAPEEADEYLELAQGLQLGTWIEFTGDDGMTYRARLTWVSSATGVYLFTDCKGLKAGERTPPGLAAEFRRRTASIIKRVPLFDRAVSSLMDGLKRRQAGAVSASA